VSTTETEIRDETSVVETWRAEQLEMAGYGAQHAAELAIRHYVDLHVAVELISRGCAPELAVRILL
jgi:hypothetical protein